MRVQQPTRPAHAACCGPGRSRRARTMLPSIPCPSAGCRWRSRCPSSPCSWLLQLPEAVKPCAGSPAVHARGPAGAARAARASRAGALLTEPSRAGLWCCADGRAADVLRRGVPDSPCAGHPARMPGSHARRTAAGRPARHAARPAARCAHAGAAQLLRLQLRPAQRCAHAASAGAARRSVGGLAAGAGRIWCLAACLGVQRCRRARLALRHAAQASAGPGIAFLPRKAGCPASCGRRSGATCGRRSSSGSACWPGCRMCQVRARACLHGSRRPPAVPHSLLQRDGCAQAGQHGRQPEAAREQGHAADPLTPGACVGACVK